MIVCLIWGIFILAKLKLTSSIKPAKFIGRSRTPEESSEEIKYVEIKSEGASGHFEKSYKN